MNKSINYLKNKIYNNNIEMIIPSITSLVKNKKMISLNVEAIGVTPLEQILRSRQAIQDNLIKIFQDNGSFKYNEKIGILFQTEAGIKIQKKL